MFSTPKVENALISPSWSGFRFSVCLLLCTVVISPDWRLACSDIFPSLVYKYSEYRYCSINRVIRIQLLFYVGVSGIIDKLVDSLWRLRQLWVRCHSILCSSSLATFSRRYCPVYIELVIHGRKCHAGWWATQLQHLSVIDLTGTTHKL